jgi:hypothetical protein
MTDKKHRRPLTLFNYPLSTLLVISRIVAS